MSKKEDPVSGSVVDPVSSSVVGSVVENPAIAGTRTNPLGGTKSPTTKPTKSPVGTRATGKFICDTCGKSFKTKSGLKGHCGAMKGRGEDHPFPDRYRSEGASPPRAPTPDVEDFEPEPLIPKGVDDEEDDVEPEPTELEMLNTILKDNGVKKRNAVLRSMSIGNRDPRDLIQLMYVLGDVGIHKGRRRAIIDTYAEWIDVEIPELVLEELGDHDDSDRSRSRRGRSQWRGTPWDRGHEEDGGTEPDAAGQMVDMAEAFTKIYRVMNPNVGRNPRGDSEVAELRREIRELTRMQMKDLKDENKYLRDEIEDMKKGGTTDARTDAINRAFDSADRYIGLLLQAGGSNQPPPTLPRVLGRGTVADILVEQGNSELVEEWSGERHD